MKSGLNLQQVAFIRLFLGCIFLVIYSVIKQAHLLKISKKWLMYSVVIGLICQALFNLAYLNAIESVELIFAKLIGWFIIGKLKIIL